MKVNGSNQTWTSGAGGSKSSSVGGVDSSGKLPIQPSASSTQTSTSLDTFTSSTSTTSTSVNLTGT